MRSGETSLWEVVGEEARRRARRAQRLCDLTGAIWAPRSKLALKEALGMTQDARQTVLKLVPGKEQVFNLLDHPRFLRFVGERFRLSQDEMRSLP